ncbi:pantetheine-phosphate adenylyltransferase [Actinomycetaceae bacterium WB03_NA08]|uniref:Phosphopantetheine adenylyltransferase n=1 Tax=Scrofimicrobium canadense TaxID=2652290 RepID=A0A6N7W2N1_9ACTO|nr:pantetheine-phosphate adenylyltransferase [Scrofimicrobium canadense]MSS83661.1 pantetheine-phosphate adenylyltransferase [Scrofimicrobium canadense]
MTTAIIPGSFDPPTVGHLAVIEIAQRCFDRVVVAVGVNPAKHTWFSALERVEMILESTSGVEVVEFDGLLADTAGNVGADCIVKGLRGAGDLEYEQGQAWANGELGAPPTLFLPTDPSLAYISSSLVKDMCRLGIDVSAYVPPATAQRLLLRGEENA